MKPLIRRSQRHPRDRESHEQTVERAHGSGSQKIKKPWDYLAPCTCGEKPLLMYDQNTLYYTNGPVFPVFVVCPKCGKATRAEELARVILEWNRNCIAYPAQEPDDIPVEVAPPAEVVPETAFAANSEPAESDLPETTFVPAQEPSEERTVVKMTATVYFEVNGLACDENGNPSCAGLSLSFEYVRNTPFSYEELASAIDKEELLSLVLLNDKFSADDVNIITPEEYAAKYGDDNE